MANGYFLLSPETCDGVEYTNETNRMICFIPKDQRIFYFDEDAGEYWVKKAVLWDIPGFGNPPFFTDKDTLTGMNIYIGELTQDLMPVDYGTNENKIAFYFMTNIS
jgi:hypothetical protein